MEIRGHIHNGVVVLDHDPGLPEGTAVVVSCPARRPEQSGLPEKRHVVLPLVRTGEPGTVHLTNERIAEILDEEDAS
jgi:hypothetical protein